MVGRRPSRRLLGPSLTDVLEGGVIGLLAERDLLRALDRLVAPGTPDE